MLSLGVAVAVVGCVVRDRIVSPIDKGEDLGPPHLLYGSGPSGSWHYARPGGLQGGDGADSATAWELQWAFDHANPGDTVWLLGGDYTGTYRVSVAGTQTQPIVFRQAPGRIATLRRDAGFSQRSTPSLHVLPQAEWTEYWDFEITPTTTIATRTAPIAGDELPHPVWNEASHTKFVNLILHDGGVAFLNDFDGPRAPENVLISGCLIYNNGWDQSPSVSRPRGAGHALYVKNNSATGLPVVLADNVIFNQFGYGIHIYTNAGRGDSLKNIHAKGNISFNNGTPSAYRTSANLGNLGKVPGRNLLFERNMLYFSPNDLLEPNAGRNLVYREADEPPATNSTRTRNYVVGGSPFTVGGAAADGWTEALSDSVAATPWPGNTVIVRRTAADPNRANVVVYHGSGPAVVSVDLPSLLAANDSFEVRNAFAFRVVDTAGRYHGPVELALGLVPPPPPHGWTAPDPIGAAFTVFVVTKVAPAPTTAASAPPPRRHR
ncbi:MAG: right-handed parallel beta-helix repeat-containing protein [Gammaproteobacteria bacterium]